MIQKLVIFVFSLGFGFGFAQKNSRSLYTEAKLNTVSIYQQSAELFASAEIKVPKGSSEIVVTNIANNIDESSIKIGASKKVSVLTYQFTDNAIYDVLDKQNPKHKLVMDSITLLQKQLKQIKFNITSVGQTIVMLDKNMEVKSSGLSFSVEVAKLVDYYQKKREELQNQNENLIEKQTLLQEKLSRLQNRFSSNAKEIANYPKGKIVLQINSENEETVDLSIRYNIADASWEPYYDVIAKSTNDKIELVQKALIKQNSGLDWKNVSLQLISGQPNEYKTIPTIVPWEITYEEPIMQAYGIKKRNMQADIVADNSPDMAFAAVQINQNQLNMSYDLKERYTITSNNQENSVLLDKNNIDANFTYFAIPKNNPTAFLIAEIPNLDKYNLIRASANVIFQDTNVGKTTLEPETIENQIQLTLGDDRRIAIKRSLISDKSFKKSVSSSNNEQQFAYEINIKNNKKEKINIVVKDQIPISTDKQIVISLIDSGEAQVNDQGELKWDLKIGANESKKIRFIYKVNSLKNKRLSGL